MAGLTRRDARRRIAERFFFDKFTTPDIAPTGASSTGSTSIQPGSYLYAVTHNYAEGESDLSPITSVTLSATAEVSITGIPAGDRDLLIHGRSIYRTTSGGDKFYRVTKIFSNDPNDSAYTDTMTDSSLLLSLPFKTSIGDLTVEEMNDYIDRTNRQVSQRTRCLFQTTTATTSTSVASYAKPTDALEPFGREVQIWHDQDELVPTNTYELDYNRPKWRADSSGKPSFWYQEDLPDASYRLHPAPDSSEGGKEIIIRYPAIATISNDNTKMLNGNYSHYHDLIVDGVVAELEKKFGTPVAVSAIQAYELKLEEFRREINRTEIPTDMLVKIPKVRLSRYGTSRQSPDDFDRKTGGSW